MKLFGKKKGQGQDGNDGVPDDAQNAFEGGADPADVDAGFDDAANAGFDDTQASSFDDAGEPLAAPPRQVKTPGGRKGALAGVLGLVVVALGGGYFFLMPSEEPYVASVAQDPLPAPAAPAPDASMPTAIADTAAGAVVPPAAPDASVSMADPLALPPADPLAPAAADPLAANTVSTMPAAIPSEGITMPQSDMNAAAPADPLAAPAPDILASAPPMPGEAVPALAADAAVATAAPVTDAANAAPPADAPGAPPADALGAPPAEDPATIPTADSLQTPPVAAVEDPLAIDAPPSDALAQDPVAAAAPQAPAAEAAVPAVPATVEMTPADAALPAPETAAAAPAETPAATSAPTPAAEDLPVPAETIALPEGAVTDATVAKPADKTGASAGELAIVNNAGTLDKLPPPEGGVLSGTGNDAAATDAISALASEEAMIRPLPKKYLVVQKDHKAGEIDTRLTGARLALSQGRTQAALQIFNELYADYPRDKRVMMGRAVSFQKLGQTGEALAAYEDILNRDPKNLDALTNMLGLLKKENPGLAVEKLLELREAYPFNADITAQLGVAYAGSGEYEEALRYLEMADALKPGSAFVLYNKGVLFDKMGRTAEAGAIYRQIVRMAADGYLDQGLPVDAIKRRLAVMR